jgi:hypothetical protein
VTRKSKGKADAKDDRSNYFAQNIHSMPQYNAWMPHEAKEKTAVHRPSLFHIQSL